MAVTLIFSIVGPDRPGLVETLAEVVTQHQGNWLESRMAHLGGHFAGIVSVSVPPGFAADLTGALKCLEKQGLSITVRADAGVVAEKDPAGLMQLELVGADRPGIVRMVSQALAKHGCNVEEFTSEVTSAPMTGEPLFNATISVHFPAGVAIPAVQAELEQIAADLMVEIHTK